MMEMPNVGSKPIMLRQVVRIAAATCRVLGTSSTPHFYIIFVHDFGF